MNDSICVMCGAQLPTECEKQYCAECEKVASVPKHIGEIVQERIESLKNIFFNEFINEFEGENNSGKF